MGTIPTPPTLTAGAVLTAAQLNQMRDVMNFWAASPRAMVYAATTQSISNAAYAAIAFDSEAFDVVQSGDSPMHDNATSNTRLYARTAGKYRLGGQVSFAYNATGGREMQIRMNAAGNVASGTQLYYGNSAPVTGGGFPTVVQGEPFLHAFNAGDYIEMFAQQNSGGALSTNSGIHQTFCWLELVAQ